MKDNLQVRHHNNISEAVLPYTAKELDLFCYLIANIHKSTHSYTFNSKEIKKFLSYDRQSYKVFENFLDNIGAKYLLISEGDIRKKYYVFEKLIFNDREKTVEVKLTESIAKYLIDLKSNFNSYSLDEFISLKKLSSKRLYQLIKKNQFSRVTFDFSLTLDDFRFLFNCDSSAFKRTNNLFTKVILPSIEEINEKTNYSISINKSTKSNLITHITFHIVEKIELSKELLSAIDLAKRNIYISKSKVLTKRYNINKLINTFGVMQAEKGLKHAYKKITKDFSSLNYLIKTIASMSEKQLLLKPFLKEVEEVEELVDISTDFSNKEIKVNNALTFTEEEILSGIKRAKEDNVCPQFLDRLRKSNKNIFLNTIKNYID